MTEYSKINVIYRLQRWLDSVPGQTFLNYAYSWGASIVILGALFTLTHLPGANLMIFIGMGTEVVVFFISAFDRPFDKTAIGKELPTHVSDEVPNGTSKTSLAQPSTDGGSVNVAMDIRAGEAKGPVSSSQTAAFVEQNRPFEKAKVPVLQSGSQATETQNVAEWIAQQQQTSKELEEATNNYIEELKHLTDLLAKVSAQSQRLAHDSEEMDNLNRTLTGISRVYEMQLKSASSQVGTIDKINEQSNKMAVQIEQLNKIYARMIEAMTVNMRAATPGNTAQQV